MTRHQKASNVEAAMHFGAEKYIRTRPAQEHCRALALHG
jgi:hypothetical protein